VLVVYGWICFLPWDVAWNVKCAGIFIIWEVCWLGSSIQGSVSHVYNLGEVSLPIALLFFIIKNWLLLLLLSWSLIVHHFTRRMGSVWQFVQLLWGVHLRRLNTMRMGQVSSRVCVVASSELASKTLVFVIVVCGIDALEVCLCRQIGLLNLWDLVGCSFLNCPTNPAKNRTASHSSWGSWSALIVSQSRRWFLSRLILTWRLLWQGSSTIPIICWVKRLVQKWRHQVLGVRLMNTGKSIKAILYIFKSWVVIAGFALGYLKFDGVKWLRYKGVSLCLMTTYSSATKLRPGIRSLVVQISRFAILLVLILKRDARCLGWFLWGPILRI